MDREPFPNARIVSIPTLSHEVAAAQVDTRKNVSLVSNPTKFDSDAVFDRVYEQIVKGLRGGTVQEKGNDFIRGLEHGYSHHIRPVEDEQLGSTELFKVIKDKIEAHCEQFKGDPSKYQKSQEQGLKIYNLFRQYVIKLVQDQQVDPLVAKVFVFTILKTILTHYSQLVQSHENVSLDNLQTNNSQFVACAENIWSNYPQEIKKLQQGAFYHFLPDKSVPSKVATRVYISAKPNGSPANVLDAWYQALQETNLLYKVYFKIPTGLGMRTETIVVYLNDNISEEDLKRLFTSFKAKCSSDLLDENSSPAAKSVCQGVSVASEPESINKLLKYSGSQKTSYNLIIAHCMQLAFEFALRDAKTANEANITPRKLKPAAQKYFTQFIKLVGINPDTMIANTDHTSAKVAAILENI